MKNFTVRELAAARREQDLMLRNRRDELTTNFIYSTLASIDTPVSLGVWLQYSHGEHFDLAHRAINPRQYNDGGSFARDLAAVSLLSKAEFLRTGIDTQKVALASFAAGEEQCRRTNIRLFRETGTNASVPFADLLFQARCKISRVLGEFDPEAWVDASRFGPGGTTSLRRDQASYPTKFRTVCDITSALDSLYSAAMHSAAYPTWVVQRRVVEGNKVIVVPKNAKTGRTIAKEPDLNIWFQKGIGTLLRQRLKTVGIDLDSQERNQAVALLASNGSMDYATVDFKNASNTLSYALVQLLLPDRWFKVMDACRSKSSVIGGKVTQYEMFSSMGNGFTFELESLIFWALGAVLSHHPVYVFGDDVCVHNSIYDQYRRLCDFAGFTVNESKTFHDSYFRESCGAYYFNGVSVKPYFLRKEIDRVTQVYKAANGLRRLAIVCNADLLNSNRFRRPWLCLYLAVSKKLRLSIPAGVGDCGFVHPRPKYRPGVRVRPRGKWIEGFTYIALRERTLKQYVDHSGLLLARLVYPSGDVPLHNEVDNTSRVTHRFVIEHVQTWYESDEEFSLYLFRNRVKRELLRNLRRPDDEATGVLSTPI